ncbi:hypothetical protein QR98_0000630 [Sarcoptes scabiei]|uniref:Uncharacterized protein n=1 Tax=Sarcoptes scabiei TaxID=52283 RepID=A0A131ZSP5_SARSC|nr:hypothetical protein QR98_0000630 [Sarcoptes scabiei]
MEDSNDIEYDNAADNESLIRNNSPSDDENLLNDPNYDLCEEESFDNDLHDDDDYDDEDFETYSEIDLPSSPLGSPNPKSDFFAGVKDQNQNSRHDFIQYQDEEASKRKRSSGRLRKDGKLPMHAKNLFPGRPRIKRRKLASNTLLNFSENPSSKSPSNDFQESRTSDEKSITLIDSSTVRTIKNEIAENYVNAQSIIGSNTGDSEEIKSESSEIKNGKILSAKKKINHPGKIKGKLGGRRSKTMEYRKKRSTKGKFKNYSLVSMNTFLPVVSSNLNNTNENEKTDDSASENKLILCSSKDAYVLNQDVCVMCGTFGRNEESKLISCVQCGQCYHPFCAGIKIANAMLEKGWRCLECTVCEGCGKPTDESRLLLCDDCDISYHIYCLDPPLEEVPQGTWKCKWCVICVKCQSKSPGYRSQWEDNYTLCGPCASQKKCLMCKSDYLESDLIIKCLQCEWYCDSIENENECEIASSIGYNCPKCRPNNEPPVHVQARQNGTLRSIFSKKRAEELSDPILIKKNSNLKEINETSSDSIEMASHNGINQNNNCNGANKSLSKYHCVDGIYLSDAGLTMFKSQQLEQPKKSRVKRKNLKDDQDSKDDSLNKDIEDNVESESSKQTDDEKKKRFRRLDKLGIGGFTNKQRNRLSIAKEEEESIQDYERSNTPDNPEKPKRKRKSKKKNHLLEQYPVHLQEAFFGRSLLDKVLSNNPNDRIVEYEEKEEDENQNLIEKDKIIDLNPEIAQNIKMKNDELNFLDGSLDDYSMTPDDAFVDMLFSDESRTDAVLGFTVNDKQDVETKMVMDEILDSGFNFEELNDDTGLPQMDCKDVEDLFGIMTNNPLSSESNPLQQNEPKIHYSTSVNNHSNVSTDCVDPTIQTKPNIDPLNLPMIAVKSDLSDPTTPVTPDPMADVSQQFGNCNANPMFKIPPNLDQRNQVENANQQNQAGIFNLPINEQDSESSSQNQKNFLKWEAEEALGHFATISSVLYANVNHPNLRKEFPVLADRVKQIHKIWRQTPTDQRQPYLQRARDNRAAQKKNQNDQLNKINSNKNKLDNIDNKQWKQELSSSNLNSLNGPSNIESSQSNESLGYQMSSEFSQSQPTNNAKHFQASHPVSLHPGQSMAQSSPNQMLMQSQQTPHPQPMSPAIHSPRMRPFNENYVQTNPQHNHQMIRSTALPLSHQGSFSPSSPSLNQIHQMTPTNSDCYQDSCSTPQRSPSIDIYAQTNSPYMTQPRTPFSPSHRQSGIHSNPDPYSSMSNSQSNMVDTMNIDVYKSQHHLMKSQVSESNFMQSMSSSSSLPSTPQPPQSPQLPIPSPMSDIYARSPSTPRQISNSSLRQQVSSQFDDNYNPIQNQSPDLCSSSNPNAYSPQHIQKNPNPYNVNDCFNNSDDKVQIRPNMITNVPNRPNIPMRRSMPSEAYLTSTHQQVSANENYSKLDESDPHSKQHLRNLLQVQQIRRPEPQSIMPLDNQGQVNRQNWPENNNFRQPLSPAFNRNRMAVSTTGNPMYQMDNQQPQQRILLHRAPNDSQYRPNHSQHRPQQAPQQQRFPVRFSSQQPIRQNHLPIQQHQRLMHVQHMQTQSQSRPMNIQQSTPVSQMNVMVQLSPNNQNIQFLRHQQMRHNDEINSNIKIGSETKPMSANEIVSNASENVVEDQLPVELGDDDELLQLGNDFNILEYADPELDGKNVVGIQDKNSIFDELEDNMLNEKIKDNSQRNEIKSEMPINRNQDQMPYQHHHQMQPQQQTQSVYGVSQSMVSYANVSNDSAINAMNIQNKSAMEIRQNPQSNTIRPMNQIQTDQQQYLQTISNQECFMSDDDFERLKNDYLNDSSESQQMISTSGVHQQSSMSSYNVSQQRISPVPQGCAMMSPQGQCNQQSNVSSPSQSQQMFHQQQHCQYSNNPQHPSNQISSYPSRMPLRTPINHSQPSGMPRHMQPSVYHQQGNRIMLQQQSNSNVQMSSHQGMVMRPTMTANMSPMTPMSDCNESFDLLQRQKVLETEIAKFRKAKKSLNAKQRQCRKNQNELNENDANELNRVSQEIAVLQKQLDQIRKRVRQTNVLPDKRKSGSNVNLPHSPSTQTSPRSVNSPKAVLSASGPGTPLAICPSTPQSPSLTSPSPSSLMQNSPMSNLHSPASLMPQSPMPHSADHGVIPMRPQIVQEDNNPFSDVYLQKEKKQTSMYSSQHPSQTIHQIPKQTIYGSNYDDSQIMPMSHQQPSQQIPYYGHGQPSNNHNNSYSLAQMRSQMQFNDTASYRFQNVSQQQQQGSNMNPHFMATQQTSAQQPMSQQISYQTHQQIRRPPPPPYPSKLK